MNSIEAATVILDTSANMCLVSLVMLANPAHLGLAVTVLKPCIKVTFLVFGLVTLTKDPALVGLTQLVLHRLAHLALQDFTVIQGLYLVYLAQ